MDNMEAMYKIENIEKTMGELKSKTEKQELKISEIDKNILSLNLSQDHLIQKTIEFNKGVTDLLSKISQLEADTKNNTDLRKGVYQVIMFIITAIISAGLALILKQ